MKITRRQLGQIIREAIDTQLSRAISKGNLPDARPDEKRASRRAERRFGKQLTRTDFDDDYPPMSGLGPADDHLESITAQDMADAKRYARSDLPRDQADYLDISVEEWHRIRQELDDHYEDRHMEDQMTFDDDPDLDDDGMLSVGELVKMTQNIADDVSESKVKITRKQLRQIIKEEANNLHEETKVDMFSISDKVASLTKQIQFALQKAKDPNLTKLGRIIGKTGEFDTLAAVYGKDNAALKARLEILKRFMDNTSKG
tara:strand:- start:153 stop:929 length:777 start_codon:yes stop_codon:yes gene_type:complete